MTSASVSLLIAFISFTLACVAALIAALSAYARWSRLSESDGRRSVSDFLRSNKTSVVAVALAALTFCGSIFATWFGAFHDSNQKLAERRIPVYTEFLISAQKLTDDVQLMPGVFVDNLSHEDQEKLNVDLNNLETKHTSVLLLGSSRLRQTSDLVYAGAVALSGIYLKLAGTEDDFKTIQKGYQDVVKQFTDDAQKEISTLTKSGATLAVRCDLRLAIYGCS
jgi:hypothetical protein